MPTGQTGKAGPIRKIKVHTIETTRTLLMVLTATELLQQHVHAHMLSLIIHRISHHAMITTHRYLNVGMMLLHMQTEEVVEPLSKFREGRPVPSTLTPAVEHHLVTE